MVTTAPRRNIVAIVAIVAYGSLRAPGAMPGEPPI
jgi:hypothetical protein